MSEYCKNCEKLQEQIEELETINQRLLHRLEVDDNDTSLVFKLDKELRIKGQELATAIIKQVELQQENEELKEKMQIINDARITLLNIQDGMCSDLVDFKAKNKLLKEQLQAEREKVKELEEENKELHYQLTCSKAREQGNLRNCAFWETLASKYEQALEEIAKYTIKEFCENCDDDEYTPDCTTCEYKEYLDIISKAKGEENEW